MANINNLAMATAMAANPSISIKKGFLGLTTKIEYKPTKSPVKVITTEFSNDAGSRMRQLLNLPAARLDEELKGAGRPKDTPVGPYLMEALVSHDHRFAAVQLFRYAGTDREAITDIRIAEGDEAAVLSRLAE